MEKIRVYIAVEDDVTDWVIRRLIKHVLGEDGEIIMRLPARGGQIKSVISNCNLLAQSVPVILLMDVDDGCAPTLKKELLNGNIQNEDFIMNLAVDEAEAWLMADREGFSAYFGIPMNDMPIATMQKQGGLVEKVEMQFSIKSSTEWTHYIAHKSNKSFVKEMIAVAPNEKRAKGKGYNEAMKPFIQTIWDVDSALNNSDSLQRAINRLENLKQRKHNSFK